MSRILKASIIVILAVFLGLGSLMASGGLYDAYKLTFGEPRWQVKYNQLCDAVGAQITALCNQFGALSNLVTNWIIVENQDILIPGCTYSSASNFTVAGDLTTQFAANAKVRVDLGSGTLKGSYVASSSYATGTTTVILHDSILTNPLSGVWVTATRNGLYPYGPGYVVARDYGSPGQTALDDALAAIGILERTLVLTPGTWTISANTTILANVCVKVERGAILSIATTKTLTINGSLDAGLYQVFSCTGTGTVSFATGTTKTYHPEWFGFSAIATGVNNQTYLTQFIAAVPAGGTIKLPEYSAAVTGLWTITKACEVNAYGSTLTFADNATPASGVRVVASNVHWLGGSLVGPQSAALIADEIGFLAYGADLSHYLSDIVVRDLRVSSWGYGGIVLEFCQRSAIYNPTVSTCYYLGIFFASVNDSTIIGGTTSTILSNGAFGNAYGVIISKDSHPETISPMSNRNKVIGHNVYNVPGWHGFDMHGGVDNIFDDCHAYNCRTAFCITNLTSADYDGVNGFGAIRPKVVNCSGWIDHSGADAIIPRAYAGAGLFVNGNSVNPVIGGVFTGNVFDGHGADGSVASQDTHSVYMYYTLDCVFDNAVRLGGLHGLMCAYGNVNARIQGTVNGLSVTSLGAGVYLNRSGAGANTGTVVKDMIINVADDNNGIEAYDDETAVTFLDNKVTVATGTLGYKYHGKSGSNYLYYFGTINPFAQGKVTWDPASIAAAGNATTVATVAGMNGTMQIIISADRTLDGLVLSTQPANGSFTLRLDNPSAGAIDLGSINFYFTLVHSKGW